MLAREPQQFIVGNHPRHERSFPVVASACGVRECVRCIVDDCSCEAGRSTGVDPVFTWAIPRRPVSRWIIVNSYAGVSRRRARGMATYPPATCSQM